MIEQFRFYSIFYFNHLTHSSLHEKSLNLLASRTSGLSEFTGPNDFYRPPKVFHKKFDKNQTPVGLLDFQFSLARPQIHWPRSSDQWVFVKTDILWLLQIPSLSLQPAA
jgi:hypothetical protein